MVFRGRCSNCAEQRPDGGSAAARRDRSGGAISRLGAVSSREIRRCGPRAGTVPVDTGVGPGPSAGCDSLITSRMSSPISSSRSSRASRRASTTLRCSSSIRVTESLDDAEELLDLGPSVVGGQHLGHDAAGRVLHGRRGDQRGAHAQLPDHLAGALGGGLEVAGHARARPRRRTAPRPPCRRRRCR